MAISLLPVSMRLSRPYFRTSSSLSLASFMSMFVSFRGCGTVLRESLTALKPFLLFLSFDYGVDTSKLLLHPVMVGAQDLQPFACLLRVLHNPLIGVNPARFLVLAPVTRPIILDVIQVQHLDSSPI